MTRMLSYSALTTCILPLACLPTFLAFGPCLPRPTTIPASINILKTTRECCHSLSTFNMPFLLAFLLATLLRSGDQCHTRISNAPASTPPLMAISHNSPSTQAAAQQLSSNVQHLSLYHDLSYPLPHRTSFSNYRAALENHLHTPQFWT